MNLDAFLVPLAEMKLEDFVRWWVRHFGPLVGEPLPGAGPHYFFGHRADTWPRVRWFWTDKTSYERCHAKDHGVTIARRWRT